MLQVNEHLAAVTKINFELWMKILNVSESIKSCLKMRMKVVLFSKLKNMHLPVVVCIELEM